MISARQDWFVSCWSPWKYVRCIFRAKFEQPIYILKAVRACLRGMLVRAYGHQRYTWSAGIKVSAAICF